MTGQLRVFFYVHRNIQFSKLRDGFRLNVALAVCPRTFHFVPVDTPHSLLYVKYNVHGGKSVKLRVMFWLDIKYRAAVGRPELPFPYFTGSRPTVLQNTAMLTWQQTTRQLARQKEDQILHWPYRSPSLLRDTFEGYWQVCRRKCSDRLYGSSQLQKLRKTTKPWRDISEEIGNKDHQTHFRIKSHEATEMSEGDWGKPRGNLMQDNRILRIRSTYFFWDITDILFVKILNWYFVAMMLRNRTLAICVPFASGNSTH
jgi:hypothetical protein